MNQDQYILKQYVREGSREALDQLIRQYQNLVYSAAIRQVRDPHLAEDVAQAVFIVLSRKANTIREGVAVGGWLLAVTRRASVDAMRKRAIQYRHEHAAARAEASIDQSTTSEWEQIAPVIDEAMSHLSNKDRDAVVLRYFEDQPFAQVGRVLSISEAAARKRVGRAIERLRGLLSRRGATLGAAALGTMMTAHAVQAAPVTITISTAAASSGAIGIAKGAIHMMAWAKAKAAMVFLSSVFAVGGGAVIVTYALAQQQPNPPAADQPQAAVGDQAAIQGNWQHVSTTKDGRLMTTPPGAVMMISEKQIITSNAGRLSAPMSYEIDPAHEPKWITMKLSNGQLLHGIYELNGDSLRICTPNDGTSRPTQFISEPAGVNRDLIVLHRGGATSQPAAAAVANDDRKATVAKVEITNFETALDAFEIDTGRYPTGADGLNALRTAPTGIQKWRGPYVRSLPQDPWGHPYRYLSPGVHHPTTFDLWSAGPDGIDQTDDDIVNWK